MRPRGKSPADQCVGRVQATSYCDTLFGFLEFCGCSPAYFVPATPSGLNADPGAEIEWPGWLGVSSQLAFGWPVACAAVVVLAVVVVGLVVVAVVGRVAIVVAVVVAPERIVVPVEARVVGMLARAVSCMGAPPPRPPGPANAAADTSDSAQAAAIVMMDPGL